MGTHFFRGSDGNKFPPGFSRNKIRGLTVGTSAPAELPLCPWTAGLLLLLLAGEWGPGVRGSFVDGRSEGTLL